MKKFLSLALALVMSLSLLTVGAGATEYKDLNDKNEIKYEEAVAVLNKLGIITGYEDGSFKPTGALTRGAAAKIIVSLMIGSDAASSLTVAAAPYKDVPVTNTFAAVISYCKTAGYISGYTDGTFRPTASLTGFAFTKMLLGALGYDGKVEGFTGSGWTMNAAKLGNKAGLFDNFKNGFKGNDGVSREGACLLALNTLKGTEVEYSGNTVSVTGKDINVAVGNNKYEFVVNNNNSDGNIYVEGTASGKDKMMQFGEEHFTDLKMVADGSADDDFGRPANEWSYKNVKIGTYAQAADKTYTTGADGDTDADMVKDMGLKDYKVPSSTYTLNGKTTNFKSNSDAGKLAEIANLTGNGVLVEAYQDDNNANTVTSFVVIKTQLMQVNSVKSSEVTLKKVDDYQNKSNINFMNITSAVKDDDDAFQTLKGLKADDYVLVVPVSDGGAYKVDSVSIPQAVTGKLTNIATKSNNGKVKAVTVAGTSYSMSDMWTSEDGNLTVDTKLSNTTDSTVYLDSYGYAIFVKDVTSSNSSIVVDELYSSLVDGKIVKSAKGWDTNGNELTINLGNNNLPNGVNETNIQGRVFEYTTDNSHDADYKLLENTATLTKGKLVYAAATNAEVKPGAYLANVGGTNVYFDSNVKFIFLSCDYTYGPDGKTINGISDVTGMTVKSGVSEVTKLDAGCGMYYVLNKDGNKIVAVVVQSDNDAAVTANLMYVQKVTGYKNNAENKRVALFTAYINGEKVTDCEYTKDNLVADAFYTYSKNDSTGVYSLTTYTKAQKSTSVATGTYQKTILTLNSFDINGHGTDYSDTYFKSAAATVNEPANNAVLNAKNATIIDLYTDDGVDYSSLKDMRDALKDGKANNFQVSYIYNGSDNSGAGTVSYLFIIKNDSNNTPIAPVDGLTVTSANGKYSVTYTGDKAPTNEEALTAVQAQIVKDGYTIDKATLNGSTFEFEAHRVIGSMVYNSKLTFPIANIVRTYAYTVTIDTVTKNTDTNDTLATLGATGTYSKIDGKFVENAKANVADYNGKVVESGYYSVAVPTIATITGDYATHDAFFSVVADKPYAKDNEVVTITIKSTASATADANDTFAFSVVASSGADTYVNGTATGITAAVANMGTVTLQVNNADVVAPVVTITGTTVA